MPNDAEQPRSAQRQGADRPRLDFQEHLADLEAEGLLVRIERPINKDTELHPLVRWQFLGGIPEDKRRAFLFTHVVDSQGGRYDIPVAVGALAASPRIYSMGMGKSVEAIGAAWMHAIAHPIAPVGVTAGAMFVIALPLCIALTPGSRLPLLGLPVEVTPAVFAYSMLYPYTDNYLDDPAIPRTTSPSGTSNTSPSSKPFTGIGCYIAGRSARCSGRRRPTKGAVRGADWACCTSMVTSNASRATSIHP